VAEQLLGTQEALSPMELISRLFLKAKKKLRVHRNFFLEGMYAPDPTVGSITATISF
jgi:hypothetical protein